MAVDRILTLLFAHSGKATLLLVVIGGLVAWIAAGESDPMTAVRSRCAELKLPARTMKFEPGSDEEGKFLLMVPARQRARLPDGQWVFCRANLATRPR